MNVLRGLRVIDLSENLAGPWCTRILADLGADVIKIERPGGDPARPWGPPFCGEDGAIFSFANAGKRSVVLDLRTDDGRAALWRLVDGSDVFVQSFRRGVIEALGFGADAVRARRPGLVYCTVSAFGPSGPLRDRPGYDPLIQAMVGLFSVTGEADGPPVRVGTSIIDIGTGLWAAVGVLAALHERAATGRGAHVETSLFDTGLAWMGYHLLGTLASGVMPGRHGTGFPSIAPYDAFLARDGRLMIAAANDGLFSRLCGALDLDAVAADPRFGTNAARVENRTVLHARIEAATRALPLAALEARLIAAGVPCAPVLDTGELLAHPQTAASGMLRPLGEGPGGARTAVALPVRWNGERPAPVRPPPRPGADAAELLGAGGVAGAPGPDADPGTGRGTPG
jgi:crotonobetainyl-CoA:carnitine CoA-transferase CaiB-like acyl-CoA transferase